MKLPIDTSGMMFLAAGPPEPVVDFDTKAAKVDESGQAIFAVQVVGLRDGGAEVLAVKVAGEPKGIAQGVAVKLVGLVPNPGPWATAPVSPSVPPGSRRPAAAGPRRKGGRHREAQNGRAPR